MPLLQELKQRICRFNVSPGWLSPNFPLGGLVEWAEASGLSPDRLLSLLGTVQTELEAELDALDRDPQASPHTRLRHEYWCFYCEQIRSYYLALLNHPEYKDRLALIRRVSAAIDENA